MPEYVHNIPFAMSSSRSSLFLKITIQVLHYPLKLGKIKRLQPMVDMIPCSNGGNATAVSDRI